MKSRWTEQGAIAAMAQWGEPHGKEFALRLYTAGLIGSEPALVLHGGGNVSVKSNAWSIHGDEIETICVKATGRDMSRLAPDDLPAIELAPLRRLRAIESLDDVAMVNEIRRCLLDTSAPTPTIETLVHAFLPHRFIDHSHADAVLCLTNQPNGEELIRRVFGDRVAIAPYVKPGFELARTVANVVEANPGVKGVVLMQHGLLTFAEDARASYERHIAIVDACESFVAERTSGASIPVSFRCEESASVLATKVAPMLRGLLANSTGDADRPWRRMIFDWRCGDEILSIVNSQAARKLAESGPLTGDHLIRTRRRALYLENPEWANTAALRDRLAKAVEAFRDEYLTYIDRNGGSAEGEEVAPRVVLLPGAGVFGWGSTKAEAKIAADIAEHTLLTKSRAERMGDFVSLPDNRLFEMEYRGLQRAKLHSSDARPLAGQVVAISGGAGAIGSAIAEVCAEAGAHVALTDVDAGRAARAVERIADRFGSGAVESFEMDVTNGKSVRDGFDRIVRTFGGVDVVVPNAGIAHVSSIDELAVDDFRRVMDINATGCLLFMREGIRVMKEQGLGGNVVVISSKNVFGPGRAFGAYSASKAAAAQLGKVAALECADFGIRVNMIAPDAVFGDAELPSGLWKTVGPDRAKSRGVPPDELELFYRRRSLLKSRVTGRHVGNAVVFFASNQTPTTGATLPVDGGLPEAFPR